MIPMAISIISFLFIGAVNGGPAYEEVYSHPGAIEPEQDVPLMYIDIVEEMHFEMDITVHSLLSHYKKFFQCTDGGDYTKVLYIETHHDGQLVPKWTTADSIWGTNTPKKGIVAGETYHLEMDMAPGSWTVTLDGVVVYDRTELGDPLTLDNIPCYIFSNSINGGADVTVSNLFIGVPEDDVPSCSGPVSVDDIVFTPSGMSWNAANDWCSAQGMELVSIHDEESQNAVYEACKTGWSEGTSFSRVWFGLNAIDQPFSMDNFMWSDGSGVDYTNWRDGHPRIDEECIMMYCGGGGSQGTWASHECSWHQPYGVCRRCSATNEPAVQVAVSDGGSCVLDASNVKCWGKGKFGANGNGAKETLFEPPSEPIALGADFEPKFIDCGNDHCCSVSSKKEAKCWGRGGQGRLGQGNGKNLGDEEGEMGDNLNVIDLGSDFSVEQIACGGQHTCALSTNHKVKCFGKNQQGRLGYEHTNNLGDKSAEMGDALPNVDLGTDFEPIRVEAGSTTCVLSIDHRVKCWGLNNYGQCGYGHTNNIGDRAGTMGDNLADVDLGAEFVPIELSGGLYHFCVLSVNQEIKCWGKNGDGQLGLGDAENRGDDPDEMGDWLPSVDLGTDFVPYTLVVGSAHTICVSVDGEVKAWGKNGAGQLGYGDKDSRGNRANEMGDWLPFVDLGSGLTVFDVSASNHNCMWLRDDSQIYLLKCFGRGDDGRLGIPNQAGGRGDEPDEMGDYLPVVISYSESDQASSAQEVPADPRFDDDFEDLRHFKMIDAMNDGAMDTAIISVSGQDLLILALLILNVVLVTILVCKCTNCWNGQNVKYQAVKVLSENEV